MRPVTSLEALPASLATARREADAAFGDGRLLIEKLITRPRHIEVQVLGDKHGHLVHLFERDCSVQRHHQKLLEEAPAPNLSDATRDALHRHAVKLATAIGYDSVGTMEFIVDAATEEFFFLEMNTRLQVEHTVTEEITGLDLVEWQLRVAAGEPLPFLQSEIRNEGHAIQARVTAERADKSFRPDVGQIKLWSPPREIRIDSGVTTGTEIGLHYDSLLAKVIATGPDRAQALARLSGALDELTVLGPATNRAFLCDATRTADFVEGRATTGLIDDNWPGGWSPDDADLGLARRLAAIVLWFGRTPRDALTSPWSTLSGFRSLESSGRRSLAHFSVASEEAAVAVNVTGGPHSFVVSDAEGTVTIDASVEGSILTAVIDGKSHRFPFTVNGRRIALRARSVEARFEVRPSAEAALDAAANATAGDGSSILAPMPGLVADIMVAVGDDISAGQTLAVLESMKLFTDLKAPSAGRVARIAAVRGETVTANALIISVKLAEPLKS